MAITEVQDEKKYSLAANATENYPAVQAKSQHDWTVQMAVKRKRKSKYNLEMYEEYVLERLRKQTHTILCW